MIWHRRTSPGEVGIAIEEDDVLVAEMTSSVFNVALPLLGAIVTDEGGMLSHPATVAREFGIPAVVNRLTPGVKKLLADDAQP